MVSGQWSVRLKSGGEEGVFEEHGDSEWPHAAGHRGDGGGDLANGIEIDVAAKLAVDAVDAHVDHDGAGADHVGSHESRLADGGDQDVGLAGDFGKIFCLAMTDRDGGIGARAALDEHDGDRFADDFAPAEDDDVIAGSFDPAFDQQLLNTVGRARQEPRTALDQQADIFGVKGVDVFERIDRVEDFFLVDLFGERELDEDAVHRLIAGGGIELRD